ncbi:MAG: UDP-N-acetyl-D-mannosamine dehydrogenase [Phototrophicaceae bacterium]
MSLDNLQQKIEAQTAHIAQIGLGYVGLPVACMFAKSGFRTTGLDVIAERVEKVNQGINPIEGIEPGLADLIKTVVSEGNLHCTTDVNELQDADVVIVAVQTPVEADTHKPRYENLRAALSDLGKVLQDGALVIIESTIAPSTMHNVVIPTLEASSGKKVSEGFYLGHCPERVMPGRLLYNIENMDRVIGGYDDDTAQTMKLLYQHIIKGTLDTTDVLTAELVKTTENAYRDVQIAFANEVARICEALGGDVWKVRDLVNKSPGRQMLLPGAGVGGHCIPKDPWLLISAVQEDVQATLIPTARHINESMPAHVLGLTQSALADANIDPADAIVAVLGYAYLENSDDTRHSPSEAFIQVATPMMKEIRVHDPFVQDYQGSLDAVLAGAHVAVILVAHNDYKEINWATTLPTMARPIVVDARAILLNTEMPASASVHILGKGQD